MNKELINFSELYRKADTAGKAAAANANVDPMIVYKRVNPLDDSSEVIPSSIYVVNDGVCGFAKIIVKPANCRFAKWLLSHNLARRHYEGGVYINVNGYGQSLQRKEAYANAFADTLVNTGINAYMESRLD